MPFKDKFKKALGIGDDHSSQTKAQKPATPPPDPSTLVGRRRPIEQAQKDRMQQYAFSEDSSERKGSFASQYSPMNSKLPSRHNSADAGASKHAHGPSHVSHEIKQDEDDVDPIDASVAPGPGQPDPDPERQLSAPAPDLKAINERLINSNAEIPASSS